MAFNANEHRQEFKKVFIESIRNTPQGSVLKDDDVIGMTAAHNINLTPLEIKQCIRDMEKKIGEELLIRLKRLRGAGYYILDARDQANLAAKEGGEKVKRVLKKTSQRLKAVDSSKLTAQEQKILLDRTMAYNSLLNIIQNSVARRELKESQIQVLGATSSNLQALALFSRKERTVK